MVDSTLSWKPHVTELSKKLARTCGIFCKLRQYVSPEILNVLYYSLFFSIVSYGISIWGLTHPSTLDILFKLQKKAIRIITFNDRYTHTNPLFSQLKILKISDILSFQLLSFIYQCQHDPPVSHFENLVIPLENVHNYGTRQATKGNLYLKQIHTTQYGIRSVKYTGSILWNDLPVSIRKVPSLSIFKKRLKEYFFKSYHDEM